MGHKMFLMGIYFVTCKHVMENPEMFSRHSNLVSRNDPTIEEMKQMMKTELVSNERPQLKNLVKRNSNSTLESTDKEEEEVVQAPKKKKLKKDI